MKKIIGLLYLGFTICMPTVCMIIPDFEPQKSTLQNRDDFARFSTTAHHHMKIIKSIEKLALSTMGSSASFELFGDRYTKKGIILETCDADLCSHNTINLITPFGRFNLLCNSSTAGYLMLQNFLASFEQKFCFNRTQEYQANRSFYNVIGFRNIKLCEPIEDKEFHNTDLQNHRSNLLNLLYTYHAQKQNPEVPRLSKELIKTYKQVHYVTQAIQKLVPLCKDQIMEKPFMMTASLKTGIVIQSNYIDEDHTQTIISSVLGSTPILTNVNDTTTLSTLANLSKLLTQHAIASDLQVSNPPYLSQQYGSTLHTNKIIINSVKNRKILAPSCNNTPLNNYEALEKIQNLVANYLEHRKYIPKKPRTQQGTAARAS